MHDFLSNTNESKVSEISRISGALMKLKKNINNDKKAKIFYLEKDVRLTTEFQ